MWSGTVGNAIDQSDYRIDESSMSSEWVEGWNWIFICIVMQRSSRLIETYILGQVKHAQILSKVHTRYFQNEEFALYILKIDEGVKYSFDMWGGIYRSILLIQYMSQTI